MDSINSITLSQDKTHYFRGELLKKLRKQIGFKNLTRDEIDITKADGSVLRPDKIKAGKLNIKVKNKANSTNFIGEKYININVRISVKKKIAYLGFKVKSNNSVLNGDDLYVGTEFGEINKIEFQ